MATYTFSNSAGGNWGSGISWLPGGIVPGAGDTADITNNFAGADYTVAVTDAEAADTVNLGAANAELAIEAGGTLTMTGTLNFTAGTLSVISGGELSGATVDDTADNSVRFIDGILDNVTWLGNLDLTGVTQSSLLTLTGGLSVFSDAGESAGGTINITGPGAELDIGSSMTLDGTAGGNLVIDIGVSAAQSEDIAVDTGDVLTLGSLTTVSQSAAGSTVGFIDVSTGGTLVNLGTMSFTSGAGSTALVTVANFTNSGTVTLVGGGTSPSNGEALTISPQTSFSDSATGVFNVSDFGVLNVEGPSGAVDFSGQANISGGSAMYFGVFGGAVTSGSGTGNVVLTGTSSLEVQFDYQGLTTFGDTTSTLKLDAPGNFTGQVAGFAAAPGNVTEDTIDLLNTTSVTGFAPYTGTALGGTLTVLDNSSTVASINLVGDYRFTQFSFGSDNNGGTDVFINNPVCYCGGTRLATPGGEAAVEDIKIGDLVMTVSGAARPVKWVGRRAFDGRFIAGNHGVLPVRIVAGALADGVPARDLCVSPGHALYIGGVLVRAEYLINGATIVQEEAAERVDYFHIELQTHDILIAEGAAAESYLDCDNRGKFHNAAEFSVLYPDDERPRWQYCAPLLEWDSPELDAIRARLMGRAGVLGHRLDLNPDLHLVVDGTVIPPASVDGRRYRFVVAPGAATVSLASRTVVPAETRADARDRRRLGVPIERLVLYDPDLYIDVGHGHQGLGEGFHDDEPAHRWTEGFASLPERWLRAFPGDFTLEVHLVASDLPYRLPHPIRTRAAA